MGEGDGAGVVAVGVAVGPAASLVPVPASAMNTIMPTPITSTTRANTQVARGPGPGPGAPRGGDGAFRSRGSDRADRVAWADRPVAWVHASSREHSHHARRCPQRPILTSMSATPTTLPYGSWPSPITLDLVVAAGRACFSPWLDGTDLYALESRPEDGGRVMVIRRAADGTFSDAIPTGFNARTRVHEYGGGSYTVGGGILVFSNFADNLLYRGNGPDAAPTPITSSNALRFADLTVDVARDRVIAVLEDHTTSDQEPLNTVVAVSLADGSLTTLASGHEFYANPRLDPAGTRLAWLSWDRPNMPWTARSCGSGTSPRTAP